jgi:hypothetical protein
MDCGCVVCFHAHTLRMKDEPRISASHFGHPVPQGKCSQHRVGRWDASMQHLKQECIPFSILSLPSHFWCTGKMLITQTMQAPCGCEAAKKAPAPAQSSNSDSSECSTFAHQRESTSDGRTSDGTDIDASSNPRVVYRATPLFTSSKAILPDIAVYLWCVVTHVLLTFWPYCGVALIIGTKPRQLLTHTTRGVQRGLYSTLLCHAQSPYA